MAREAEYSRRLEDEVQRRTLELAARNSDLEELNLKLAEASLTDSLTGLRNRRFLFEHVSKDADLVRRRYIALKQGDEARTFDLSFVMIDLDCFKAINDTCGHAAGDLVLLGVRSVLEKTCRSSRRPDPLGGRRVPAGGPGQRPRAGERPGRAHPRGDRGHHASRSARDAWRGRPAPSATPATPSCATSPICSAGRTC